MPLVIEIGLSRRDREAIDIDFGRSGVISVFNRQRFEIGISLLESQV